MRLAAELAVARANVYGFLATCYLKKPSEWLTKLKKQGKFDLVGIFGTEGKNLQRQLNDCLSPCSRGKLQHLDEEFHALFSVPGDKYLTPYESCYREKKLDGSWGNNWGCNTVEVQFLYKRAGATVLDELGRLPDHFGVELAFLEYLCLGEESSIRAGDFEQAGTYQRWQRGFLNDHLLQWSEEFLSRLEQCSEEELYFAIAAVTREFLIADSSYLTAATMEN
ncbi:TorD/DmsD family molecular chaperone [Calderihabitans maritimus]|nr:molecular chaperone TorD family protein [Calderihabitans maritimus]